MLSLLLFVAQSGTLTVDVKLAVPPGACAPTIDGRPATLDAIRTATADWQARKATVQFAPDAAADPVCMQRVLKLLQDAGAGDRFPLTILGDDMSGVDDE